MSTAEGNDSAGRRKVTVEIAGRKHVLRSDVPAEYTRVVAAHVDRTIAALQSNAPPDPHRVAILAALSITDELFRAREELRRLRDDGARSDAALAEQLREALAAARPPD